MKVEFDGRSSVLSTKANVEAFVSAGSAIGHGCFDRHLVAQFVLWMARVAANVMRRDLVSIGFTIEFLPQFHVLDRLPASARFAFPTIFLPPNEP